MWGCVRRRRSGGANRRGGEGVLGAPCGRQQSIHVALNVSCVGSIGARLATRWPLFSTIVVALLRLTIVVCFAVLVRGRTVDHR